MTKLTVADVRAKFPQYEDLSDEQLLEGVRRKFYADIPREKFFSNFGMTAAPSPSADRAPPAAPRAPVVDTTAPAAPQMPATPEAEIAGLMTPPAPEAAPRLAPVPPMPTPSAPSIIMPDTATGPTRLAQVPPPARPPALTLEATPAPDTRFTPRATLAPADDPLIAAMTAPQPAPAATSSRDLTGSRAPSDPFEGEGLGALAARRGQQFAQGATDVIAAVPEALAITGERADRSRAAGAAGALDQRAQIIADIEATLADPNLDPEDRAILERNLADLTEGQGVLQGMEAAPITPAQDRPIYGQGEKIRTAVEGVVGAPDPRDRSFWGQVATGAGNMTGMIGAAAAGTVVGGPIAGAAIGAGTGSAMNQAQVFEEALQSGADQETALQASRWAALIGASEIIPITRALKLLPPRLRGELTTGMMRKFVDIAQASGEEAAQEYLATVANNIVAQQLYDPERGWTEGATDAALVGAVLGAGVGTAGVMIEGRGDAAPPATVPPRPPAQPQTPEEELAAALGASAPQTAPAVPSALAQPAQPQAEAAPAAPQAPPEAEIAAAMGADPAPAPEQADPTEGGRFEILDEIENTPGGPVATGRKVRVDLETGQATVVGADGTPAQAGGAPGADSGTGQQPQAEDAPVMGAGDVPPAAARTPDEELAAAMGAEPQARPDREIITPANDTPVGTNAAGEPLFERADGSRYRMRSDRADRPEGYPDFGGDLSPATPAAAPEDDIAAAMGAQSAPAAPVDGFDVGARASRFPTTLEDIATPPQKGERGRQTHIYGELDGKRYYLGSVTGNADSAAQEWAKTYPQARILTTDRADGTSINGEVPELDAVLAARGGAQAAPEAEIAAAMGAEPAAAPAAQDGKPTFAMDKGREALIARTTLNGTPVELMINRVSKSPTENRTPGWYPYINGMGLPTTSKPFPTRAEAEDAAWAEAKRLYGAGSAPPARPGADPMPEIDSIDFNPVRRDTARTPAGTEIEVEYAVIELDDLIASNLPDGRVNPNYPQERQPRDRTKDASERQIQRIMRDFDPRQLLESPTTDTGAMIVDRSGYVESGNGRTLALQRIFADRPDLARAYVEALRAGGYPLDGMDKPVLVRIRRTEMTPAEIEAYTRESNTDTKLAMSATEQAMSDAAALPDSALDLYRGGDIDTAGNRDFVRAFIQSVVTENEQGKMIAPDGSMSQDAVRRVQAALLAKAYGDPALVSKLIEAADNNIKSIGGALLDVSASWAKMRAAARAGTIAPEMDQTEALIEAVRLVDRARTEKRNVIEFVKQPDLLSGDGISPMGQRFLALMFKDTRQWTRPAGRDNLARWLSYYVEEAMKSAPGADLFGAAANPGGTLDLAKEKQDGDEKGSGGNQADLFAPRPAGSDGAGVRPADGGGDRPGPQGAAAQDGEQRPAGQPEGLKPPLNGAEALDEALRLLDGPRSAGFDSKTDIFWDFEATLNFPPYLRKKWDNKATGKLFVWRSPIRAESDVHVFSIAALERQKKREAEQATSTVTAAQVRAEGMDARTKLWRPGEAVIMPGHVDYLTAISTPGDLFEKLAAAKTEEDRRTVAADWVSYMAKNEANIEYMVMFDTEGRVIAAMSGTKSAISFPDYIARAKKAGAVGYSVHNHPSNHGPSPKDMTVLMTGAPNMEIVGTLHRGPLSRIPGRHMINRGPAFPATAGKREIEALQKAATAALKTLGETYSERRKDELAAAIADRPDKEAATKQANAELDLLHHNINFAFEHIKTLALARAGIIDYEGNADALARAAGVNPDDFIPDIIAALEPVAGRLGLQLARPGDQGGNRAAGSNDGADGAAGGTGRSPRGTAGASGTGDRGGRAGQEGEDLTARAQVVAEWFNGNGFERTAESILRDVRKGYDWAIESAENAIEVLKAARAAGGYPEPNENLVYSSNDVKPGDYLELRAAKRGNMALIELLEVAPGKWVQATRYEINDGGSSGPLMVGRRGAFASRDAALADAVATLRRQMDSATKNASKTGAQMTMARKILAWLDTIAPSSSTPSDTPPKTRAPKSGKPSSGNADLDAALDDIFGDDDVSGPGDDLERDSGDAEAQDDMGGTDVPPAAGGSQPGAGKRGGKGGGTGGKRGGRRSIPGGDAAPVGGGGDPGLDAGGGTKRRPAAGGDGGRRAGAGQGGLSPDAGGGANPAGTPAGGARVTLTDAERAAAIRDILKENLERMIDRPGFAEGDGLDPRKYEALEALFIDGMRAAGADPAKMSDRDMFRAIATPLKNAGLDRETIVKMAPYLEAFTRNVKSGRVKLDPEPDPQPAPEDKAEIQRKADRIKPVMADEANIRATLPLLLPEQQDDVLKIERRFAKPDGHGMLITNGTGTGKAQPLDAKILTPEGWRTMGELAVGDMVISADGTPTEVVGVYPQGGKPIYRVEFSDGAATECCDEHLWETQTLYARRKGRANPEWGCAQPQVRALAEIRATLDKQHFVPVAPPIQHPAKALPVRPYTLGVLLGDGCLRGGGITITGQDEQIAEEVAADMGDTFGLARLPQTRCPTWRISDPVQESRAAGGQFSKHRMVNALRDMGLMGADSAAKFIPADYLTSSIEDRTHLLQGLMDTDGTVDRRTGSVSFCTVSPRLADGVVALTRSLGGIATTTTSRKFYTHNGERREGQLAYIVTLHLPNEIEPFRLSRKAVLVKAKAHAPRRKIVSVSVVGTKPAQCIAVAHPRHLYVTDDYVLTHNTFTGGGQIKRFVQMGKSDILIVAPSEAVIAGWKRALEALGVEVSQLRDTRDAGRGVVITTYANLEQNQALATRSFDLVVADESQNLMSNKDGNPTGALQNLRAITHRPADLWRKHVMIHADEYARLKKMRDGEAKTQEFARLRKIQEREVEAWSKEPRSKVLFLSATPFAYDKTVDYVEGYLFDYPKDGHVGHSRQDGRALFMIQNFGYRIRYHKLTKPESAVDSAVFEREFHEKLKREGVLSGRSLQIDVDYDRKFVTVADAIGTKIDAVLKSLSEGASSKDKALADGYRTIRDQVMKKFNYLKRMQLLEAIKAKAAVDDIKGHLALGRKVVVFHDYNVGGGFNPFGGIAVLDDANAIAALADLMQQHPDLNDLDFSAYGAPADTLKAAFGKQAAVFSGLVPQKQRLEGLARFNTDDSGTDILIVQSDAGGAGISMHDLTGTHQRVLINLGMPTKPTTTLQEEGRILRVGTVTDAIFRYYTIGTAWERAAFAQRIAERSGTVENLALGNEARMLRDAFIDAYVEAEPRTPSAEDGKGGKAKDGAAVKASPYEIAKTHYFGKMKVKGRRDQREGDDWYATPEPLGFKMVQWAGARPNERVLEPSAGDGAIARYFPENVAITMVEPSNDLGTRAQLRAPTATLQTSTFEDYHIVNKHHVIVMNPPYFRNGGVEHLAKAARHLRDGGRIVALIQAGPNADKHWEKWWNSKEAEEFNWTADIALPAVAFERAGTNVMTRIVILDRISDKNERAYFGARDGGTKRLNFTGAKDINDFFDRIEMYDVPRRPDPKRDVIEELEAETQTADAAAPSVKPGPALTTGLGGFKLGKTKHSKTGDDLFVATIANRVEREVYTALAAIAKSHGGWYSNFRGNGAIPGFQFKSEEARAAFLEDAAKPTVNNDPEGLAETAYHGTPHDFDRFSLSAIGTGEGAQMFGWGLYFAGRREVAEWYRRMLSRANLLLDGKPVDSRLFGNSMSRESVEELETMLADRPPEKPEEISAEDWRSARVLMPYELRSTGSALRDKVLADGDDPAKRLRIYRDVAVAQYRGAAEKQNPNRFEYGAKLAAIDWMMPAVSLSNQPRLYTVDIPDADQLLDWDAQLSDQPPAVIEAMRSLLPDMFGGNGESVWTEEPETEATNRAWRDQFGWMIVEQDGSHSVIAPSGMRLITHKKLSDAKNSATAGRKHFFEEKTGQSAYRILSVQRGGDRAASEALRAAGIPGHRYLDGSSRNAGQGAHNYVIYDDQAITILEKQQKAQMTREAAAATSEILRLMPRLRAELDRLDLKRVKLYFDPLEPDWQGMFQVTGDGDFEVIIGAALDPMKTLHHEVIHIMRQMNLFTPEEWRTLELAAGRGWMQRHDIEARYPHLTHEERLEEAIAEEFSWALEKMRPPKGNILVHAFNKIHRLLKAIRNVFQGAGFNTPEDIFGRILSGEISKRQAWNTGYYARMGYNLQAKAPRDTATGDLFAQPEEPKRTGMTADQRREMEARQQQSKMRKTGGNSGDAGPLFDDQTDLFGQRRMFQAAPAPTQAEVDTLAERIKVDLGLRDLSMFISRGDLKVNMIAVDRAEQGRGKGTEAMRRIVAFADARGLRITLSPGQRDDGFGTTSRSRLVDFYKRFGFKENKGRSKDFAISEGMYREPARSSRMQARPLSVRPLTPQGRAHRNTAMGGPLFIPDRRVWDELTRAGVPMWQRIRNGAAAASDAVDRARQVIQDRFLPVLRAQEAIMRATGRPIPADQNAYIAETTFSGKVGRHLLDIDEVYTKPIIQLIAETNGELTVEGVGEWLYARHAIERNAYIASINPTMPDGGSGMTDQDAQDILSIAAAGPHAARLKEIGRLIDGLRERTLKLREDAGLISNSEAALWRSQYKYYVPLKGFAETDHAEAVLDVTGIGKRYSIRGQESRRALGRSSEAFNPLQAAITQAQEASIRAEKNRVGQALYELAKGFPSKALWEVKTPAQKRYFNRSTGLVETRVEDPVSLIMDPNEMAVKVNGKEVRIILHDERLARAANTVGADQMSGIMRLMSMFSRFFSMTRTMLNPEFMVTNAFRDFQTAQFNIQAFGEADKNRIAAAMAKNWRKAFLGVMRGQKYRFDTEWSRYFDEFQKSGAQVWFWTMEQPEVARNEIEMRVKLQRGGRARRVLTWMTTPSAIFSMRDNPVLAFIEKTNLAVDNAIRLAAFVEARKAGWSVEQAAFLAKELTVNFNRRGEVGAQMNALYPFFNAAIQGTVRTAKALTSKRVAKMVGVAFVAGLLNDLVNAALSEEDEDEELVYDKIPDYRNERNIHIGWFANSRNPVAIPMPYGYNVFPYAGQQLGKVIRGVKDPGEAFGDVMAAAFGAFSPINAATPLQMVSPVIADPIAEMAENKNWLGAPIYPQTYGNQSEPDAYVHFRGATEVSKMVAQALNGLTGGDFRQSGAIDVSPETLDHLASFVVGSAGAFWGRTTDFLAKTAQGNFEEIEGRNVPFVRNVFSPVGEWVDRDRFYQFRAEVRDANADAKAYVAAGLPVPADVAKLAGLYDKLLEVERELNGKGDWNPARANALTPREDVKIYLDFNREYLRVAGKQGQ